jgi:Golgi phosphoprotein 3
VLELAFRGRIAMQKTPSRRSFPLPDRILEVIDDTLTGEVLLDEALKMMKTSEKMSVASWIDLMSGMPPSTTSTNTSDQELGGMLTDNR